MKIAIGVDHRGVALKEYFLNNITDHEGETVHWSDVGCASQIYCDYPEYAVAVANQLLAGTADRGVLICGSGVGMAITANRFPGVYAALAWNEDIARLAREHDNANILVLPADYVDQTLAEKMICAWLSAEFMQGKYQQRIEMIDKL